MGEKLLLVPWSIGILYSSILLFWFVVHPLVRRWQGMQRSPYRLLLPLWAVMIGALVSAFPGFKEQPLMAKGETSLGDGKTSP